MTYAPLFAVLMLLWTPMAVLGAQGFSPLLGLAGLLAIPFFRSGRSIRFFALTGLAFLLLAMASTFWSPAGSGGFTGTLAGADFALESAAVRIGLTALAAFACLAATAGLKPGLRPIAAGLLLAGFALHGLAVAVEAVWRDALLAWRYGEGPEVYKGLQNMLRTANAFALVLPLLVAALATGLPRAGLLVAAMLFAATALAFAAIGTQAGLLALALIVIAMGLVRLFPAGGLAALFTAAGAYVALAPLLFLGLVRLATPAMTALPTSFQSRLYSWQEVLARIGERPLLGHGIEASGTWQTTYAARPDWLASLVAQGESEFAWSNYPLIPGHPHNMALEIWAETGVVGALLAAATLVLIGRAIAPARTLPGFTRYATAGLLAAALSLFSFAYSAWNEAFWASVALAAASLIVLHKRAQLRTGASALT